jgi:two-component system nitrogen regulation sensor histidine kinase GlnL
MSDTRVAPDPRAQLAGLVFATLLLDPDSRIAEANPAAEELLGRSARQLAGQPVFDLVRIADARVTDRNRTEPLIARGVAIEAPSGAKRVNLTLSPLGGDAGWRMLTLSELGSEEGENAPEHLAAPAVLAHEIKNPLAAIRGASQLLARKLDPGDKSMAQMIVDEVDRIAALIDSMQRLGSVTAQPNGPVNLHAAIRRALATMRAAGGERGQIVEEFDPSLPPVLGNQAALEQVVINLVANAREASDKGRVTIATRFVSGPIVNDVRLPIELTVSDDGPGIAPALRDHVFEPFVTTKKSGEGLGLPLVRRLLRDMDGRIAHDRDERAGLTRFRVQLPMTREERP